MSIRVIYKTYYNVNVSIVTDLVDVDKNAVSAQIQDAKDSG